MDDEARVLVVDDSADLAEALAMLLRLDGYVALTESDPTRVMERVALERPHCVLMDVQMPELDGAQLSRLLRDTYGDDIVLLAMTGRELDDRAKETFGRVDHYLSKPIEPADLRKVLPPLR